MNRLCSVPLVDRFPDPSHSHEDLIQTDPRQGLKPTAFLLQGEKVCKVTQSKMNNDLC